MIKKGFTLAEVLITLMIVGVVATLTTPALVKNVGSSKIGPQLSKFVNTWETAMETMMMEENVSTFGAIVGNSFGQGGLDKLSKYMIMTNLKDISSSTSTINITNSSGTTIGTMDLRTGYGWQLKDGTIIYAPYNNGLNGSSYSASGSYQGSKGVVLVDIGGIKGSHRAGKEVFAFIIDNTGILVPYGSNANRSLASSVPTCNQSGTSLATLLACTGAVADNAWKAPW